MYKFLLSMSLAFCAHTSLAQEVGLPEGLEDLFETPVVTKKKSQKGNPLFDVTTSLDVRAGLRLQNDPLQKDMSLGEARFQLGLSKDFDAISFNLVTDFVLDPVIDNYEIDLETGQGIIDIREANMVFSPLDFMDVKLGRQILTWGVGDLIFINDLFAKDYHSFFIGRDDEYLKAPSDALKTSLFLGDTNFDIVYVPRFDADRFIDGSRISYYDFLLGQNSGRSTPVNVLRPRDWFHDDEWSLRLNRSFGAVELAAYYYNGFWKSPAGQDIQTGYATYPELSVTGASARTTVGRGIGSVEFGYYKSAKNAGVNPFVRNDEIRLLVGYEQEIGHQLTGSVQYYLERKQDYTAYVQSLPNGAIVSDKDRHLITVRLTKLLKQQDLKLSIFNFYSPSDKDGYMRFNAAYKLRDNLRVEIGGNVFYGKEAHSFFGQFEDTTNLYTGLHFDF